MGHRKKRGTRCEQPKELFIRETHYVNKLFNSHNKSLEVFTKPNIQAKMYSKFSNSSKNVNVSQTLVVNTSR